MAGADQDFLQRRAHGDEEGHVSFAARKCRATTTVVIITVFLFALFFWLVDLAISNSLERALHYFSRH